MEEYGILYKCVKLRDGLYVLDPKELVTGYSMGENFYYNNQEPYKTLEYLKNGEKEFVVSGITTEEVLADHYEVYDDSELLKDYYFVEEEEYLVVVQIKDGEIQKRKIKRQALFDSKEIEIYDMSQVEPFVCIDSSTISKLKSERNIDAVRKRLDSLQTRLIAAESAKKQHIDSVTITNSKMAEIKVNDEAFKIAEKKEPVVRTSTKKETTGKPQFTLLGLEEYLKERIMGHDKEIREIATTVYNNYKATEEDTIESIFIPGPTGVGKTETAKLVCKYLNVPYLMIDCSTLVPEGIVGTRLGDEIKKIVLETGYDEQKIKSAIFIMDEFDKIALTGLDIKAAARFELLKFIEGKKYVYEGKGSSKHITVDTSRIFKFFLGAFGEVFQEKRSIGFAGTPIDTIEDMEQKICDNTQFEEELLSRIQITIPYKRLTLEDKKRIILFSKKSIYAEKKRRILRDYGVTIEGDELYAEGVLEALGEKKESIRQMNNIMAQSFIKILYELGINEGKYHRLILSRDTVKKGNFELSK